MLGSVAQIAMINILVQHTLSLAFQLTQPQPTDEDITDEDYTDEDIQGEDYG